MPAAASTPRGFQRGPYAFLSAMAGNPSLLSSRQLLAPALFHVVVVGDDLHPDELGVGLRSPRRFDYNPYDPEAAPREPSERGFGGTAHAGGGDAFLPRVSGKPL